MSCSWNDAPPRVRGGAFVLDKKYPHSVDGVRVISLLSSVLFGVDSFARANACACTAIDAFVRVDNIDIACRNSLNGAFVDAGAACDAGV